VNSYTKGANIRRWLRLPDCPKPIQEFRKIFDQTFQPLESTEAAGNPEDNPAPKTRENVAHYSVQTRFGYFTYSRAASSRGNSVIIYYPHQSSRSTQPVAGEIQQINMDEGVPTFIVRRHRSWKKYDPFHRYPHFPAKMYSTSFRSTVDRLPLERIISHGARFAFSGDGTVIVNLDRS
jgi:hypothetical protein